MSYGYDYGAAYDTGYSAAEGMYDGDAAAAGAGAYGDDGYGLEDPITQEDCWAVIAAYFADKTLVSQQIDSFNEFVNNTMQELVDESGSLILDQNMQHTGKAGDATVRLA